jgi:hypothetical protein
MHINKITFKLNIKNGFRNLKIQKKVNLIKLI